MVAMSWESDSINYMTTGSIDEGICKINPESEGYYAGVQKIIEDHSIEASICKIVGSEALAYTVDEGVQIMGGAGFIEEYPMAGAYRDERINRIFEGTNEINRMIIGGYILKKSILEEIPIRIAIQDRLDNWLVNSKDIDFIIVEFCRSLMLNISNHLILEYGQDLKNNQWILEPFADMGISFCIIDTCYKRFQALEDGSHKNNTYKVFQLTLANHYSSMSNNAGIILNYTKNSQMKKKINDCIKKLNYCPNPIKYKQNIVKDLYKHKKYYLD